jgi:hypothetical protein
MIYVKQNDDPRLVVILAEQPEIETARTRLHESGLSVSPSPALRFDHQLYFHTVFSTEPQTSERIAGELKRFGFIAQIFNPAKLRDHRIGQISIGLHQRHQANRTMAFYFAENATAQDIGAVGGFDLVDGAYQHLIAKGDLVERKSNLLVTIGGTRKPTYQITDRGRNTAPV